VPVAPLVFTAFDRTPYFNFGFLASLGTADLRTIAGNVVTPLMYGKRTMDTTNTQPDEHASNQLKSLIERTLAGAQVPKDSRERLSSALEAAMRRKVPLLRRYVRSMSYNGRAAQMMEMYSSGKSLDEIGEHFTVTRERVRQILSSTFGDYRSVAPDEMLHERSLRRSAERVQAWDEEHGDDIKEMFSNGASDASISETLGVSRPKVTDFRSRHGLRHSRGVDWTDDDILGAIKRAYVETGQGITLSRYSQWREAMDSSRVPSYLTVLIRYGTFEKACDLAKVPYVGRSNSQRRSDYISPEDAREHLRRFLEWTITENKKATSGTFAEYREANKGVPSLAVMGRRLGGFRFALDQLLAERGS